MEIITDIWLLDADLGDTVAKLQWVSNGVTSTQLDSLVALSNTASQDTALAKTIASLPWFYDAITKDEREALDRIDRIASKDFALASTVVRLPWFVDGLHEYEEHALAALEEIASHDRELAVLLTNAPWIRDPITSSKSHLYRRLKTITLADPELARITKSLPWLYDTITDLENDAIYYLYRIVSEDVELGKLVAGFHWYTADLTTDHRRSLENMALIAAMDLELARLVAKAPWLADDLTPSESSALWALRHIAYKGHLELAKLLSGSPWFPDGRDRDLHAYVLSTLASFTFLAPHVLGQLTTQPWFVDGLDDHEAAFVVALSSAADLDLTLYKEMLEAHFIQTGTVSLPMAGEISIWAIQNAPFPPDDDLLNILKDAARISEGFMGVPFPTTDIVVLVVVVDDYKSYSVGAASKTATHMMLHRLKEGPACCVVHETAHHYSAGPSWYREGGADFIEAYFHDWKGLRTLANRRTQLAKAVEHCVDDLTYENIWHLIHIFGNRKSGCHYVMGENFLLSAYMTIGEEAMSAAMRELYLSHEEYRGTGDSGPGRLATEEAIYDAFLKHASNDRKEAFRVLYRRLHGGPYAYADSSFSDDHGDEAASASAIEGGEVVQGVLDYKFDVDYFRFPAQEGQKYRINVNHASLHFASITLYAENEWLREWQNPWIENWISRGSVPSGPEMLWMAPSSDEFYFVVRNIGGATGEYTLTITPVDN